MISASSRSGMAAAAAVLRRGGIVAFPTETVYGLAVRPGDVVARARLRRLKRRSGAKPFQLLVSSRRRAMEMCGRVSALTQRLARACWPGPLTMVVKDRNGRWIGLRVPDHPVARSLARRIGGVLVATSANRSNRRAARTAQEALDAVGGRVDLVLDAGPAGLGVASTVVRVQRNGWELLREGAISRRAIGEIAGTMPSMKGTVE